MNSIHQKHNSCRLCNSSLLTCVVPLLPVPIGEHYSEEAVVDAPRFPIDIYQCLACGAVQTSDDIDPDFLWKDYTYYSGHTVKILDHFSDVASRMCQIMPNANRIVLDIGSNDGSLLKCFRDLGCKVLGVDPALTVVTEARNSGIDTILGLFNLDLAIQIKEQSGQFDIITAFNVFAHSQDMISMLQGVELLLNSGGIFAFEVQYLEDIKHKHLLGTFFHEHMVHYSLSSAQQFLRSCELEIFSYERNNIQNGSIIIYACRRKDLNLHSQSDRKKVAKQIKKESLSGVNQLSWGIEFTEKINATRNKVIEFLKNNQDIDIVAYGAARSGPTLAIQFGLDGYITKLFDDHPSKVNKFSPYMGLRVYPTQLLEASCHPICFILAYIHYRNVIRDNLSYILSGGTFVLLWPHFSIVNQTNYQDYLDD